MKKIKDPKLEELEEKLRLATKDLEVLQQKNQELTNDWKRALADYQNLVKRYEKEKVDFVQYANTNLILKLLAVLDHLKKAQEYLKDPGLSLAIKQFIEVLTEEGLSEIEVLGKEFNPEEMEAAGIIEGETENQVVEVVSPGYRLKEKVVRVAKVKVCKACPND